MNKLLKILVDEKPVKVTLGYTVMQTCAHAGIEIPRFCYHDKLLIAGNCRICLVEVLGSKKLVAACAVHASDNMTIFTNTIRVRLARQHVLEFLLANHPLDCPICDQGGECDLQDIASVFGADRGRFYEFEKRAVLNKDFGPLIRTSMNRCIHCTRCVRFLTNSAGLAVLGTLGRGSATEISLYVNGFISDVLSGNITDLCPVGALTSKPYSFQARPWELVSIESVDLFDTLNSTLVLDVFANKISRVLPYANDQLNECWLSNRARYAYDGLFVQRLSMCLLKVTFKCLSSAALTPTTKFFEFYIKLSWGGAVAVFFSKLFDLQLRHVSFIFGNLLDLESTLGAQSFFENIGAASPLKGYAEGLALDFSFLYLFNTSVWKLAKLPTFCLLVGANVRLEAPVLNLRLSGLVNNFGVPVYRIGGSPAFLSFRSKYISNNLTCFFEIMEFKHDFCKNFYVSSFFQVPFFLIGQSTVSLFKEVLIVEGLLNFLAVLSGVSATTLINDRSSWEFSFFGFIHNYSGRLHAAEVGGCSPLILAHERMYLNAGLKKVGAPSVVYSIGFDAVGFQDLLRRTDLPNSWLIYQGTHGQGVASFANLIFPSLTHVESATFYKNLIGSVSKTRVAVSYSFDAKSNLEIFKLYAERIFTFTFNFTKLNFRFSTKFNWDLVVGSELLLSSQFLLPWGGNMLNSILERKFYNSRQYTRLFKTFLNNSSAPTFCSLYIHFYRSLLLNLGFSSVGHAVMTSSYINYYTDASITLLTASKTMSLCSNLLIKKNLSLPILY